MLRKNNLKYISLFLFFCLTILPGREVFAASRSLSIGKFLPPPSHPEEFVHTQSRCTTLLQYLQPSPDQQNAGSCLYMAITGISEMAWSMQHPKLPKADLSERYAMNLGVTLLHKVSNWKTDMITVFNHNGGSCLNSVYPYTKGWYFTDSTDGTGPNGSPEIALPDDEGARYGTYANWILNENLSAIHKVSLPRFTPVVLYKTASDSPFDTGVLSQKHVQAVKKWLYTKNRPVLVIYNHFGYWHAVVIAGYDDNRASSDSFTREFISYMRTRAQFFEKYGNSEKAKQYRAWASTAEKNLNKPGGASSGKGVFFVRDSIYRDMHAPLYDYDTTRDGEEAPFTYRWVEHDFTWLMHLANHIVGIDF